jgi:P-type conjugative transfer ATPase TrbB
MVKHQHHGHEVEDPDNEHKRRLKDKLRRELGNEIMTALDDPAVVEIMLNPDGQLWEDRHGVGMRVIGHMTKTRAHNLIGTIAGMLGVEAKASTPIVEGELPLDGSRFEGIIEPIVERPAFAIRKKALFVYTFDDYIKDGIMNVEQRDEIESHIQQKHNILVVGATGSGKTTLCNAVLHRISEVDPDTRIAIIEDTRELQCPAVNKFPFRTSEHVDMTLLLRACMRMRPDRIVVGEVRDKAALALLKSWNTGHSGGVATVHANNAEAGLIRIEQLIQESGVEPNKSVVAEAINCIVSIQRTKLGRRVEQIVTVEGGSKDGYQLKII